MTNAVIFTQNSKDLYQVHSNNLTNDKINNSINLINFTNNYNKNYNKQNISLKLINKFENALNSSIDIIFFLIIYKLNQLGINNAVFLIKQLDNRITDNNEKQKFYKELNELLDILLSKDLDKKLHPEVIKAINESTNGIKIKDSKLIKEKEFPTLRDFSRKLILDLLLALSNPNSISQEQKGTCSQTVIERAIAERMPSEYVKIIKDLITKGEYITKSGKVIKLNSGGIKKGLFEKDDRYLTTRIIAPSFMEFSNGEEYDYDDDTDYNISKDNKKKYKGSSTEVTAKEIFNTDYQIIQIKHLSIQQKVDTIQILLKLLMFKKYPIFLYTYYGAKPNEGGHAVELKEITNNFITVSNPWGQIETYTTDGKKINNPKYKDEYSPINNFEDFINRTTHILLPPFIPTNILKQLNLILPNKRIII